MNQIELSKEEIARRKSLAENAKHMIMSQIRFESEDEHSIVTTYRDFYLQISFSELHPLMVICLIRSLHENLPSQQETAVNELNLKSVLGCHSLNLHFGFYHYRSTHWLDSELTAERFFEILDRCVEDAARGYTVFL